MSAFQDPVSGGGLAVPRITSVFPTLGQQREGLPPLVQSVSSKAFESAPAVSVPESGGQNYIQINRKSWHLGGHQYYEAGTHKVRHFEENNYGLGYQRQIGDSGFSAAVGFYRGSYRETIKYATLSYESQSVLGNPNFSVGGEIGLVHGYKKYIDDKYMLGHTLLPAAAAFVSVRLPNTEILPNDSKLKISYMPIPQNDEANRKSKLEPVKGIVAAQLLIPF